MSRKEQLLRRLDEIGGSLAGKEGTLALMGVGSVGAELERMDEYSDLDFFVIVERGFKRRFIDQLDWLEDAHPLAYRFMNSYIGYKVLFEDGIFAEYAVFEEHELADSSYSTGRIVWKSPSYDNDGIVNPAKAYPKIRVDSVDYPLGEAFSNLYVGLCRYARGEKLSAVHFVQGYAIDRIISVLHLLETETDYYPDPFGNERRLERRFPTFANRIGQMMQGYDKVPESALRILEYLEEVYPVNARLSEEIRRLASELMQAE
ncbi:MAG: hypothetical protein ACQEXQ_29885 [Bacillota bacterium]